MKRFADLFEQLHQTNKTNQKVGLLVDYFRKAHDKDKIWTIALFTGRRPKRPVNTSQIRMYAMESSGLNAWLFEESYHVAGDLAETIALLLPFPEKKSNKNLSDWIEFINDLAGKDDDQKKNALLNAWNELDQQERFVFLKILTGSFRVGVSQNLIVQALSEYTGIEKSVISHRIMGNWDPTIVSFRDLIFEENSLDDISRPYPFCLAHPLEGSPETLGDADLWQAEWKWDGIRGQIIKRSGNLFVWSRGEELVTDKFPEFISLSDRLPDGTVLDGEILPYHNDQILSFNILQTRIGRKNLSPKILKEAPVGFFVYDVMEWNGEDIRTQTLIERRELAKTIVNSLHLPCISFSESVHFSNWNQLEKIRMSSRKNSAEGFMLKRKSSAYLTGRKRGDWWKWKIDPLSIDAVLIYAQKGHGRRADLYTDYTFGVWNDGILVPFAKAYSGLTDEEIRKVDSFVKRNTLEKFGPVRTVSPELVFEIGFEGIQESSRHKSGVAVRFPRILKWRSDKKAEEADSLVTLKEMLKIYG